MEVDIYECIMCTKKTIKSNLKEHFKDHHAIEKENMIQKVYEMHFAVVGMETQTNVTWVRSLKNIGDVLLRLEDTIEEYGTSMTEGSYESRKTRGSQSATNFCTESNPQALEEKLGIGTIAKYIPEPLVIEDSELSMSLSQILDDAVCVEDDDDDEPVIIKETKIEFSDSIHLFKNNQQVKKNEEPIITLKPIAPKSSTSVPSFSNSFIITNMENEGIEEIQKQGATNPEDDKAVRDVQNMEILSKTEETKEEMQKRDVSKPGKDETTKEIKKQRVSEPEEYDIIEDMQKQEVSAPEEDKANGDIQELKLSQSEEHVTIEKIQKQGISTPEIDENTEEMQTPEVSKSHVDDTFKEIQVEEESKQDEDDIIDEFQIEKETRPEIIPLEKEIKNDWEPSDATLPKGWMVKDVFNKEDEVSTVYLSPCRKEFTSRYDIKKFLKSQGKKIIKTNGLKVFYQAHDLNKIRKQTNLVFVGDNERNVDKIKDKLIQDVPKIKTVKQVRYTTSQHVLTRPYIILIEENNKDEGMIKEHSFNKRAAQKRNESWKVSQSSNSLQKKHISKENLLAKEGNKDKINELLNGDGYGLKEQIQTNKVGPSDGDRLSMLPDTGKEKEKSIVEICTLTKQTLESSNPQESRPMKEHLQKSTKSKCSKKDINIKTYMQELKDVESKRKSLIALNILEPEKSKVTTQNSGDAGEENMKKTLSKPASTRKRKFLTPESEGRPRRTETLSKDITPKLISYDLVYNKGKTPSPCKSLPRDKRKSLLDVFESNKNSSNKKQKKNDSLSDEEIKKKNIEKLKRLQQKAVEVNKREGTFIQCGNEKCLMWRLVKEYHDPSNVPDDWVCSMNMDVLNNVCGEGEDLELNDSDIVDLKYTCGSMVWGKMKGCPWWPGMVDFCPDSEEYYWLEDKTGSSEPSWYHVVFFDGKGQVSRAWIKSSDILTMETPIQIPKCSIKNGSIKTRLRSAVKIAKEAKIMTHEERLDKYSFAALYKGKWGTYSDIDSDDEDTPTKKKKLARKLFNPTKDFLALRAMSESPNCIISKTKKKSESKELGLNSSHEKRDNSGSLFFENKEGMDNIESSATKSPEQMKGCLKKQNKKQYHTAQEKEQQENNDIAVTSKQNMEKELCINEEMEPNFIESKDLEVRDNTDMLNSSIDHSYTKIKSRSSNMGSNIETRKEGSINITTIIDDIKPEELISCSNPNLDRNFPKPPLPSDVLIALAVRNLDPNNYYGAGFSSIIAFLTLHFPYYNRNLEECKEMVRRAYDVNTREETGKENFRIKGALVEQLSSRIRNFVNRSRELVKESILKPEFLDVIVDRFEHGILPSSASSFRPPYSCKMLSYLALVTLCPPSSLEQITMFISFLFPSLQNDSTAFNSEDFENILHNDENIEEFYLTSTGQTLFVLREGSYPVVLHSVRQFFSVKSNNERLKKSIYSSEVVNILLPNLVTTELKDTSEI